MDMDSDKNGHIDYKEYIDKFIQVMQKEALFNDLHGVEN